MAITFQGLRQKVSAGGPLAITALAIILGFVVILGWRMARQPAAPSDTTPPVPASLTTVRAGTVPQSIEAVGTLEAVRQVTLAPEVAGRVIALGFQAGETARAGQPIVRLYDAPERADLAAAVARVGLAKSQYQRSLALAPSGAEPVQTLQQRKAELAQAEAARQQIEARIAQKTVRAPFAGVIGLRKVNLGQYVNAGDALATITDLDRLYVNFTVPQQRLAQTVPGASITLVSDALPGRSFSGRINAVEPQVGAETRNIQVQAVLDNRQHALRPGLYGTVRLALAPLASAVTVPVTAIVTSPSGDSVLVVRKGVAASVPVTTGAHVGDTIVVTRGLAAGDVVVTAGQLRIQPGARVVAAR